MVALHRQRLHTHWSLAPGRLNVPPSMGGWLAHRREPSAQHPSRIVQHRPAVAQTHPLHTPTSAPPPSRLGRLHLTTNLRWGGGARRLLASLHLTGGEGVSRQAALCAARGSCRAQRRYFFWGQESASAPPTPILAHAYWLKFIKYDRSALVSGSALFFTSLLYETQMHLPW